MFAAQQLILLTFPAAPRHVELTATPLFFFSFFFLLVIYSTTVLGAAPSGRILLLLQLKEFFFHLPAFLFSVIRFLLLLKSDPPFKQIFPFSSISFRSWNRGHSFTSGAYVS